MDALESEFPELANAFEILEGVEGNNFSTKKLYDWVQGQSDYMDGKRKLKGMIGELIVYAQIQPTFGSDAVLHSSKTTADILIESKTGQDFWSLWQKTDVFMFRSHNLKGEHTDHKIMDGRTVYALNEIKTLDVNKSTFNRSNLSRNLISAMDQVMRQMSKFEFDPTDDLVIGVLWVDKEVVEKVMAPGPGVDHILVRKKFEEFTAAGGYLHLIRGSKDADNFFDKNLNGKAEETVEKIYNLLNETVKKNK